MSIEEGIKGKMRESAEILQKYQPKGWELNIMSDEVNHRNIEAFGLTNQVDYPRGQSLKITDSQEHQRE